MLAKATIQKVKSLAHKKFRDELRLFVAEGDKLIEDLLNSSFVVSKLFVTQHSKLLNTPYPLPEAISENEMSRISGFRTPSSSLALVEIPQKGDVEVNKNELSLALDGIQDPGNLGTIIRIADWFGLKQIFCSPSTADCYNPKVVQATMGAIARVNLYYTNLPQLLAELKDTPTYGTFLDGDSIYQSALSPNGIIVMGSEGNGITPEVARHVKQRLHIPSFSAGKSTSESLNVAVAAAISCSEFRRRL